MKNTPIFTVRSPRIIPLAIFIEQLLKDKNPNLSIAEIRNLPMSQGCWAHVKLAMEGKKPSPIEGEVDFSSIAYNAYASAYFFDAIQELGKTKNDESLKKTENATEESSSSIDTWPYSTEDTWNWLKYFSRRYYLTGYWDFFWYGDFYSKVTYRDYKEDGNNDFKL